jgi:hypothetical protein
MPTSEQVWHDLDKASFAVLSHVTSTGEPRSSGVVYVTANRRIYVAVAEESWKARHIAANGLVAVTVPVRRGGVMALMFPIPPATISFHGTAVVHPAGTLPDARLARLLPPEGRDDCRIIEIRPIGDFVTYGEGVSLARMRTPALARGRAPVG